MTPKTFDRLARELFGTVLEPLGFDVSKSKFSTFSKMADGGVVWFVMPDIGNGGNWYDVKVFPSSPLIEPDFDRAFPDSVGIPSDVHSFLHPISGVGMRQERYPCKTEEQFRDGFESVVRLALIEKAIPYLAQFRDIGDLIPVIRNRRYLGAALCRIGRCQEGREILVAERARLLQVDRADSAVQSWLKFIDTVVTS